MSLFDKAKEALGNNSDKAEQGVDKATDMAKEKFGDHAEQIDKASEKAKDYLHQQGGEGQG